jgi:deazaflavin-dependent oxidoreductase (nitroreductase family)
MNLRGPARLATRAMIWLHRRNEDRFMGMNVLYLTTTGARSGEPRQVALARFPEADGSWLVVASAAGAARHPAWYHNIAAHPEDVWVEVAGQRTRVVVEQLDGDERARTWARITTEQPRFEGYQRKTDRRLPVLRLAPRP